MECPATEGSGPSREAWKDGTGVGLPDKIAIGKHAIKEVWPTAASLGDRRKSPDMKQRVTEARKPESWVREEGPCGAGWQGGVGWEQHYLANFQSSCTSFT